jgi:hypothetical protein
MRKLTLALMLAAGATSLVACGSESATTDDSSAVRLAGDDPDPDGGFSGDGGNGGSGAEVGSEAGEDTLDARTWVSQACAAVKADLDRFMDIIESDDPRSDWQPDPTGSLPTGEDAVEWLGGVFEQLANEIATMPAPAVPNGAALRRDYPAALFPAGFITVETTWWQFLRDKGGPNTPDRFFAMLTSTPMVSVSADARSAWQSLASEFNQSTCAELVDVIT